MSQRQCGLPSLYLLLAVCLAVPLTAQDQPKPEADAAVEVAAPEPLEPVAVYDFEGDEVPPGWSTTDGEATLAITTAAADVAAGRGALEFSFAGRRGVFEQLNNQAFGSEAAEALSLKVKATSPTSLSLGVEDRDGNTYQGLLWIDAGSWVTVQARLDGLTPNQQTADGGNGPAPGQVSGFFIADLANLGGESGQALGLKTGNQKLWLDDVSLVGAANIPVRSRQERLGQDTLQVIDGFEQDVIWGLPIRQAGLALVKGAPKAPGKRALEITYRLDNGRWSGVVCAPPGSVDLAAATRLRLWASTDLNARLVIILEKKDSTKFETATKVAPDGRWHEVDLPLTDFVIDGQAPDRNRELQPGEIHRVIVLIDTFDADVRPGGEGSVTIDDLGFVAGPAAE